jgi:hypothetical protein
VRHAQHHRAAVGVRRLAALDPGRVALRRARSRAADRCTLRSRWTGRGRASDPCRSSRCRPRGMQAACGYPGRARARGAGDHDVGRNQ